MVTKPLTPVHAKSGEIERLERPSLELFRREYQDRNRPVVIQGVVDRWPAMERWTPEYLSEVAGDAPVTVHFNDSGNFHQWYTTDTRARVDRVVPLRELVQRIFVERDARYYMTEHELSKVSPALLPDVDCSAYIERNGPYQPLLFLGCDTCMPLHYHGTTEAVLCQVSGVKQVTLFGPSEWARLYARNWYGHAPLFSQVDGRQPDLERFPRYREARGLHFTLHPGEMLFIPVHWWHLTSVEGPQTSVTHFWKARFGNWSFPSPGLQTIAREVVFQGRKRLSRMRAR